jgi:hypothetical protein
MATIVTKNSSTASAVPTTSDLVQGELAVNVTDKRIFTENASTQIVELGTNPSSITTATATVTGTLTANGTFASSNAVLTGGTVNGIVIGGSTPQAITGTTVTASTGFVGGLTGNVTGNLTGNVTGNVTGNLTGNVTGNVTASSGTTTLNDLVVNGTADFTNTKLTNVVTPTVGTDAANKSYVDDTVAAVIDSAPAALDTLNELAAALGDDANFAGTVTTALATKLPLAGGTMTGAIAMGTAKITGLGDPTSAQDAATKTYVDTADALNSASLAALCLVLLPWGLTRLLVLGNPTLAQDAATKAYTDSILVQPRVLLLVRLLRLPQSPTLLPQPLTLLLQRLTHLHRLITLQALRRQQQQATITLMTVTLEVKHPTLQQIMTVTHYLLGLFITTLQLVKCVFTH